jgi:hypothetical protein
MAGSYVPKEWNIRRVWAAIRKQTAGWFPQSENRQPVNGIKMGCYRLKRDPVKTNGKLLNCFFIPYPVFLSCFCLHLGVQKRSDQNQERDGTGREIPSCFQPDGHGAGLEAGVSKFSRQCKIKNEPLLFS